MNERIELTRKQAATVLAHTFPEYRGRKIHLEFTDRVMIYDTNWSGGTRNQYHALKADGKSARLYVPAPWVNPIEGATVELKPDTLLVEHSMFCGHDCGITIYAHPSHGPKLLGAGGEA